MSTCWRFLPSEGCREMRELSSIPCWGRGGPSFGSNIPSPTRSHPSILRIKSRSPTSMKRASRRFRSFSGMSGCWTRANAPITWGNDILSVLPGTLGEEQLTRRLNESDAAVIMKVGKNLAKDRRAVEAAGLLALPLYVERGTMQGEQIMPLSECPKGNGPYFSMVLIPGQGRRL